MKRILWEIHRQLIIQIIGEDITISNWTSVTQFYLEIPNTRPHNTAENLLIVSFLVGIILSILCLITHLYKFCTSESPQSLPTKNLTFYCFFLLVSFLYEFTRAALRGSCCEIFCWISFYKLLTIPFLKFIIALDVCICLRNTVLRFERTSGSYNGTFILYCILGTGIPLLSVLLLGRLVEDSFKVYAVVLKMATGIRFMRLVLFFCVLRYIRLASFGKTLLIPNVLLHIRLVVVIGALSAISDIVDLICMAVDYKIEFLGRIPQLGIVFEGFVIGMCFTFKKDTFKSTIT